jgi:hypothetical protein
LNLELRLETKELQLQIEELLAKSKRSRKPPTQDYGKKLTTGIDETFERDGTISQIPSDRDQDRESYDMGLEER